MGCGSTKLTLHKYNGILTCNHLLYSNIKVNIEKFRDQQKINSYSLFFVNSQNNKFNNYQILLVDMATYYSTKKPKVWILKLVVHNNGKLVTNIIENSYNSVILKYKLTELIID